MYELRPIYDSRKSFYGKALVIRSGEVSKLQSYSTIVAEYNHESRVFKVFGFYSPTTLRHLKDFAYQMGVMRCSSITKKDLEEYEETL